MWECGINMRIKTKENHNNETYFSTSDDDGDKINRDGRCKSVFECVEITF